MKFSKALDIFVSRGPRGHFAMFNVRETNQTSTHYIFQPKQNHDCHYRKPVKGNKICRFQNNLFTLKKMKTVLHDYFDHKT